MYRKIIIICLLLLLSSCFSLKIDKEVAGLDPVELKQSFFFLGMIGDKEINLTEQCPRGVSGFHEKITFGDGVLTLLTLGIYAPKTVLVYCAS